MMGLEGHELGALRDGQIEDAELADELAREVLSDYLMGVAWMLYLLMIFRGSPSIEKSEAIQDLSDCVVIA